MPRTTSRPRHAGAPASSAPARRRGPALLRIAVAVVMVLAWLAGTGLGGPTFGKLSEVSSNDQSTFLPASAESTRAGEWAARFGGTDQVPALVVGGLPAGRALPEDATGERDALAALGEEVGAVPGVDRVIGPTVSEDREAVQYIVLVDTAAAETEAVVEQLREVVAGAAGDLVSAGDGALAGTELHVAGPAGLAADLAGAFEGIDGLLLAVALVVVFVILVLVYRSVLLPVLVLLNSVAALSVSVLAIYAMARADWISLNGQSQGILSILVIGAATDYSLLLVARYREELRHHRHAAGALRAAWTGSFGAITASAATVAIALLCLLVSDLNSNSSLGPIAASGIVLAWAASLTFLPAVLALTGRAAFWPSIPRFGVPVRHRRPFAQPRDAAGEPIPGLEEDHGVWTRVGALVARRPRAVWTVTAAVLVAGAVGVTQLQASGVPQTDVLLGDSDAKAGQVVLEEHFAAGTGSPATVIAPADRADEVLRAVEDTDGVASAYLTAEGGAPAGTPDPEALARMRDAAGGQGPAGPPAGTGEPSGQPAGPPSGAGTEGSGGLPPGVPTLQPQEIDGRVYLQATLADPADSAEAEQTVVALRERLHAIDGDILVGGTSATTLDTNTTAQQDLRTIIPLVLLVVLGILMILLRSLVAPVLLVLATVLSFGTAMGVSALVFDQVLGFPGADPTVPLYGFVFLVALGVDYTIFLMTRAREEAGRIGTRAGVLKALTVTGGVITSAGIVLAATFAALAVIPLMFMVQLAFIVAFGVLLDTFLVRSLLVPALTHDIGPAVWWPSRLARRAETPDGGTPAGTGPAGAAGDAGDAPASDADGRGRLAVDA
ncbi:MMPL family transporter [Citricoccus sp. SGAir0253]|uniref:MMPL family transporter n=1 Tax=Citricoccus sp. SGAir0253 TaxID=2567881 RepID=UPI0010CCCA51|nr:MMPL family transporter [Citricoccus sp. SGAir0253]QCU77299.1 MMPL family transporter [Citricoccus sp. SGAir0253]